jgi:hypothetical protein
VTRGRRGGPACLGACLTACLGAGLALTALRALQARPPGGPARWARTNHRGAPVSLLSGPALTLSAVVCAGSPLPAAVAGLGAAAVGAYDDVAGARDEQRGDKGLRGHAAALRAGRVSAGVVKVGGIGAAGLLSARAAGSRGADLLVDGALVAVAANLLNLLDLRPGRALKVGLLAAAALDAPGPAGAAAALLSGDLRERTMLGDAGANGLGAVLGLALVGRLPARRGRLAALAGGVALTCASEVVSFSRVIDAVPPLRAFDRWGRLP